MMYYCTKCGWIGEKEKLFIDINSDPYDQSTEYYDLCPQCYSLAKDVREYVPGDN